MIAPTAALLCALSAQAPWDIAQAKASGWTYDQSVQALIQDESDPVLIHAGVTLATWVYTSKASPLALKRAYTRHCARVWHLV